MADEKQVMISVITPVYNSEKYLHKCIDSVLVQTYQDFELILVNDGSTDKSGAICDEYALKDKRVKVFHKENGGVSSARNIGLKNALGDYIIHTDSDDLMLPGALESLYNQAQQSNSDIVIGNYIVRYESKDKFISLNLTDTVTSYDFLYGMLMGKYHAALWNKLVKKSCYQNYLFDERVNYMEDLLILSKIFINNPSLSFIQDKVYVYIQREDSITGNPSLNSIRGIERVISKLENLFQADSKFNIPIEYSKINQKLILLYNYPNENLHLKVFKEMNKNILRKRFISLHHRVLLWLEVKGITLFRKIFLYKRIS